jgi:SAM-dependent methyltransferase
MDIDMSVYGGYFDVIFMEGGILHYFHDIDKFMRTMNKLLKSNGEMICSDFHPIRKFTDIMGLGNQEIGYFSKNIIESEMPHARFYDDEIRKQFPRCSLRLYTLEEIINSVINNGFNIKGFEEHPAWTNEKLPGEFTLLALKAI